MTDAVVIGSGPNGLVAANLLADAGWDVVVLEAASEPGGAVRSGELTQPGFIHDLFSAFYPLGVASPAIRALELERFGLVWRHSPLVVAHPSGEGAPVVLSRDVDETADSMERAHRGDGDAWRCLYDEWLHISDAFLDTLLSPFPPIRPGARVAARLGKDLLRFGRFTILSVRRLANERFGGPGPAMLLGGNALHADLSPEASLSGMFGWMLCCMGQQFGFPVPEGGSGRLTDALIARLEAAGGRVLCDMPVERVVIRSGRAVAVRTAGGDEFDAPRGVLADVGAPQLYLQLVGAEHLPPPLLRDLDNFQYDSSTVKVDWSLREPIPWRVEPARRAGTLHLADGIDHLSHVAIDLSAGVVPARPFLVIGQMNTADPTRSPAGTETAWAYTHVPQRVRRDAGGSITGAWDEHDTEQFVRRMEDLIEESAPGFRDLVLGRHVFTPVTLEQANRNLVGGAINGGTAQLHQQLVFRPTPGIPRATTVVPGLYLASASAHPGGGVHGACGANAAIAALHDAGGRRVVQALGVAGGVTAGVAAARAAWSRRR
jgi:phytoene dehydrogenase-like protein